MTTTRNTDSEMPTWTDLEAARTWYRKAADGGNACAQHRLGWAYENGELDLAIDLEAALTSFQKAAEDCETIAQRRLGFAYEDGDLGVVINFETAFTSRGCTRRRWVATDPRNGGLEWLTRKASWT